MSPFQNPVEDDDYYKYFYDNKVNIFWEIHSQNFEPYTFSENFKNLVTEML